MSKTLLEELAEMSARDRAEAPPDKMRVAMLEIAWDETRARELAVWCEERGLEAAAIYLRHGPSNEARAMVDALACALGVSLNPRMLHWREWAANTDEVGESAKEKAARRWTK